MLKEINTALSFEYIWLDGASPQKVRSKVKVTSKIDRTNTLDEILKQLPEWNYDGSSTNQAVTNQSEIILKPQKVYKSPFDGVDFLVMCDTYNVDGTPHVTNTRAKLEDILKYDEGTMYGFEQEYVMEELDHQRALGWPKDGYPEPQGHYYCGVGAEYVSGRTIAMEHMNACIRAGIPYTGANAEVMLGQWEYQVGIVDAKTGGDDLWVSRYILYRIGEEYNVKINIHPKPYKGDWNGSGLHVNFSTKSMRDNLKSKKRLAIEFCEKLEKRHDEHIKDYGIDNEHRLTGKHETANIEEFSWGIGDRGASIRIPSNINDKETPGYIEDRRPASNADPYVLIRKMIETLES